MKTARLPTKFSGPEWASYRRKRAQNQSNSFSPQQQRSKLKISDTSKSISTSEFFCKKSPLVPVSSIDWANPDINRAGILPVCDGYFGFCVSLFGTTLSTIGGAYKPKKDHDLFSTAIREYHEEVGDNLPKITESDLYKCYAIASQYSILIFLPVDQIPEKFKPTNEIANMIWLTAHQLAIFSKNQSMYIKSESTIREHGKAVGALTFSTDLKYYANDIASFVGTNFKASCDMMFNRPQKTTNSREGEIVYGFENFYKDFQTTSYWLRSPIVITEDGLCIQYHRYDAMYIIYKSEYPDFVRALLKTEKLYFLISKNSDIKFLDPTQSVQKRLKRKIVQVESCDACVKQHINFNFLNSTRKMDNDHRFVQEPKLIKMYEELIYSHCKKMGTYFSKSRAAFFDAINTVNMSIRNGDSRHYHYIIHDKYKNSDLPPQYICYLLDRMNLFF